MWAFLGSLLGGLAMGGLSMGGSALSSSMAASSSDKAAQLAYDAQMATNELNWKMFKKNQEWQEHMSNTAHQREVKDLLDSGLNPILSATGGSGASTPSIATPTAVSPGSPVADKAAIYSGLGAAISQSVSTAVEAAEKLSKIDLNFSESEQKKKVTATEVGKRNPFTWAVNGLESNAKNLSSFASEAGGLLSDVFKGMRTQINYLQKNFQYNESRGVRSGNGVHDFGLSEQLRPGGVSLE